MVEIQGPTHFRTIHDEDGSRLDSVLERDRIKYEYCVSHGIDIYYFTYDPKLLEDYSYPRYVYTSEDLLLEELRSYSLPGL